MSVTFLLIDLWHYTAVPVLASESLWVPGLSMVALPWSGTLYFLVIPPVIIDLSCAWYLLSRVARRQHDEVDTVLQAAAPQGSVLGLVAIDHHVIKQSHSGNDSRRTEVQLTPQGEGFMLLNRIVTATFGIDPHFVARSASRTHS